MKKIVLVVEFIILCNLSFAQFPGWQWAKSAGGIDADEVISATTDIYENIYIAGSFESPVMTFESDSIVSSGLMDNYLAKYDANGNILWVKSSGGNCQDSPSSVSVDNFGNAYLVGYFSSDTITFDTITLVNMGTACLYSAIFIAKYDANENIMWAKSAGGVNVDEATSVAVDASGNVYVAGFFQSPTITFGAYTLTNMGYSDIFLTKFDTNGNVLWAKASCGISSETVNSIVLDAFGNIDVTGTFHGHSIVFGSDTLVNNSIGQDIFLAKYDSSGNVLWAKSAGGKGEEAPMSITSDNSGDIFIAGYFRNHYLHFGSIVLTNNDTLGTHVFIAKYDMNGNALWANSCSARIGSYAYANCVMADAVGDVYLTGYFQYDTITFGTVTLIDTTFQFNLIYPKGFLVKYTAAGNVLWATYIQGGPLQYSWQGDGIDANVIIHNTSGNIYLLGDFLSPTIHFDSTTLTNNGYEDIYLAKLNQKEDAINEFNNKLNIILSPNPFSISAQITFDKTYSTISLSLYDLQGKLLLQNHYTDCNQITLHRNQLSTGLYFLKLIIEDKQIETRKIVVGGE